MNIKCTYCGAYKFAHESSDICCGKGSRQVELLQPPPTYLRKLLDSNSNQAIEFQNHIRKYNMAFQLTSFGVPKKEMRPTFRIQGQSYHLIGSLLPEDEHKYDENKFVQIYFISQEDEQVQRRNTVVGNDLDPDTLHHLQLMFNNHNKLIQDFISAKQYLQNERNEGNDVRDYVFHIDGDRTHPTHDHPGRYHAPTTSEVGLIMCGEGQSHRDIVIRTKGGSLRKINELNKFYDALQYPILFPRGEPTYSIDMPLVHQTHRRNTLSIREYYSALLMIKDQHYNIFHHSKDLFQQLLVDWFSKIESNKLMYLKHNQDKLRCTTKKKLEQARAQHLINGDDIGQKIILPSTYTGSPRYMREKANDAITYVRQFGRPDLFITFTCNPEWEEIQSNILHNTKYYDRHDIVARVFNGKVKKMMELLVKKRLYGQVLAHMYSIEWQKRGLPHVHILLWLQNKIRGDDIDNIICAEIPDPNVDQHLYNIIIKNMVHGPCGSSSSRNFSCMDKDNRCTKHFPKSFSPQTIHGERLETQYRRRSPDDGGRTFINSKNILVTNQWIVPYSPILCKLFNAHINVEVCNSIKSIKYLCKYINKGTDQIMFTLTEKEKNDEILCYQIGRYINANEAAWRIFNFDIHQHSPAVEILQIHTPDEQYITIDSSILLDDMEIDRKSTLMAYFELCRTDPFAKTLTYLEIPTYYTWDNRKNERKWNRRKRGIRCLDLESNYGGQIYKDITLGRINFIHPKNSECFHLRILLHHIKGPEGFHDLYTVGDKICNSFKEACIERGLLTDDTTWDKTLQEAADYQSPSRLRELFVLILMECNPTSPRQLWNKFKYYMSEDIRANYPHENDENVIDNLVLCSLNEMIMSLTDEKSIESFDLPRPHTGIKTNFKLRKELSYKEISEKYYQDNHNVLNEDQKKAYTSIIQKIELQSEGIMFLDAPGGTGKTFLLQLILATVRKNGNIALATASIGIAATLLIGGNTVHSTFKLPINIEAIETPICNIARDSNLAEVLQQCKLIVWDECTISHKKAFEAVDRTLKDILKNNKRFGGIPILICGDFRQTLPVIRRGTTADEVYACLKKSNIWYDIERFHLTINMRAMIYNDEESRTFSKKILEIGEGKNQNQLKSDIKITPDIASYVSSVEELEKKIYDKLYLPDLTTDWLLENKSWLTERGILCPTNEQVDATNNRLLSIIPGELFTYYSTDTMENEEDLTNYPVEYLNTLNPGGISYQLQLKIGTPIMILRNLRPPLMCNGTRGVVIDLKDNVVVVSIANSNEVVFIPRLPIELEVDSLKFKRTQFPIRPCFSMTINKSQGQSMKMTGLNLTQDPFAHGQYYVAISRTGSSRNLFVYAKNQTTTNVVYKDIIKE